jgi:transcriptional regulator with XRE-family HTH domain
MKKKKTATHSEMLPFAQSLRELRGEKGWTQAEFGARLGGVETPTPPATISSWEQADKRPAIDTIMQIADLFEVSVDFLLGREDASKVVVNKLDALDALQGLVRILMEENGRTGTILLNEDFVQYLIDAGRVETARRKIGLADDLYEMLCNSIKGKHKAILAGSNMDERPIQLYTFNLSVHFDDYREWLRAMKYSK